MLLAEPLRAEAAHVVLHLLVNVADVALEIGLRAELLLAEGARKVELLLVQRLDVTIQRAPFAKLLAALIAKEVLDLVVNNFPVSLEIKLILKRRLAIDTLQWQVRSLVNCSCVTFQVSL